MAHDAARPRMDVRGLTTPTLGICCALAVLLTLPMVASAQTSMPMPQPVPIGPPVGPPAPPQGPDGKFGVDAGLLGPASLFTISGVFRPRKKVEALFGIGFNSAEQSQNEGNVKATASASITTFLARGRFLPMGRHSLLLEAGLGLSNTKLDADGEDTAGNAMTYSRSGLIPIAVAGVGYALRAYGGFRLSAIAGYRSTFAGMDDSKVTFTGNFSEKDKTDGKNDLDAITDELAKSSIYLELQIGWAF